MKLHSSFRAVLSAAVLAGSLAAVAAVEAPAISGASSSVNCAPSAINGHVNISFWESSAGNNASAMAKLVKQFNATHPNITVTDVNQTGGYEQTYDLFKNSLNDTSTTPDVVYGDDYSTQAMLDTAGIVPVSTCIAQTKYSTSGFLKKTIMQQTINGNLVALPYSASAPVLLYDKVALKAAGVSAAPTTIAAMEADAAKLVKTKIWTDGMTIKNDPWWLQVYLGMANQDFVNNNNGHTGKATAMAFGTSSSPSQSTAVALLSALQSMVYTQKDAVAFSSTATGLAAYNNLLAIGEKKAGMTIDTSATLGTVEADIKALYPKVVLGVSPLPLLTAKDNYGVQPGGNSLFLGAEGGNAKIAASWEFIQWLDSATEQATWDAATGYVPVTTAAATTSTIKSLWAKDPYFKVAYTEITAGSANYSSAGPDFGAYYPVNNQLTSVMGSILQNDSNINTELSNFASYAQNEMASPANG